MTHDELVKILTPDPRKVWFGVSKEREPDMFSKLIEKFQGTTYSHAMVIYYSQDFGDYIIANARGQASQLDTLEQFHVIDEVEFLFEKELTESERMTFIRKVVELDGIDYSEMQIVDIGLNKIFGVTPDSNGTDGIICSEYAERLGIAAGLRPCSGIVGVNTELLSPKDNFKAWEKMTKTMNNFKRIK